LERKVIDYLFRLLWKLVVLVLALAGVALAVVIRLHRAGFERSVQFTVLGFKVAVLVVLVLVVVRVAFAVTRFAVAPRGAKRNYWRMLGCARRWRWLTRNLGIAYPDPHDTKKVHRGAIGPSLGSHTRIERPKARVRYPRVRFRADEYGIIARVRTTPKAGRVEFEKQSHHIADAWRCHRVQVSQSKPGRLILRGILRDPLAEPFGVELAPAGTYARTVYSPVSYFGRDEWASHRHLNLRGVTGIAINGLPDFGKTSLIRSLACQDYTTAAVQHVVIDGKGGGDYLGQKPRLWLLVGNELQKAAETLVRLEALMNGRLAAAGQIRGPVNRWEIGPTEGYPLIDITMDECHSFFDLEAVKGDKRLEGYVRQCRSSAGNIVRMGRSVLFRIKFITQKQTGDAIPTAIRDICQIMISFASNQTGAEAVLGELIKAYPSYSPTGLMEKPTFVGVCTANLRTGSDPFVRLRVPNITDRQAAAVALATAHLTTDPEALLDQALDDSGNSNVYPFAAA
jgi:S-DNA-T family DNA segregation ATPase FtsK/SpoIIIE